MLSLWHVWVCIIVKVRCYVFSCVYVYDTHIQMKHIFLGHFPQKSLMISGSIAPVCHAHTYYIHMPSIDNVHMQHSTQTDILDRTCMCACVYGHDTQALRWWSLKILMRITICAYICIYIYICIRVILCWLSYRAMSATTRISHASRVHVTNTCAYVCVRIPCICAYICIYYLWMCDVYVHDTQVPRQCYQSAPLYWYMYNISVPVYVYTTYVRIRSIYVYNMCVVCAHT